MGIFMKLERLDNDFDISDELLEKIYFLEMLESKKNFKKRDLSYKEVLEIVYQSIDRFKRIDVPTLESAFNSEEMFDKEYLKTLKDLILEINSLLEEDKNVIKISKLIEPLYTFEKVLKEMYLLFDLKVALDEYIKNMKYYASREEISLFKNKYNDLISKRDIKGLESLQEIVNTKIKKEWMEYVSPIEKMNDDNFCFLGHSTTSTSFEGEFYHPLVSTSLYDQDITDTFNERYGFIMGTDDILMTGIDDLYVDNAATKEEEITPFTRSISIMHPKRLLEETKKRKKDSILDDDYLPVYNEVVIKGFRPTGLFCFTNGALEYDNAYRKVMQLRKYFPSLPVATLDIMKRKTGYELMAMELELLNDLNEQVMGSFIDIGESDIYRYQMFFLEFNKLKEGVYSKEGIVKIFKKNYDLISYFLKTEDLFSGSFSREEVKYALLYGYRYDLEKILEGDITVDNLVNLSTYLSSHVGVLNNYFSYLDEFVSILSHIKITEKIVASLKDLEGHDLKTMAVYLVPTLKKELTRVNNKKSLRVLKLKNTKYNLLNEQQRIIDIERKVKYYLELKNNEWRVEGFTKEYGDTFETVKILDTEINNIQKKRDNLTRELSLIEDDRGTLRKKDTLRREIGFMDKDIICLGEAKLQLEKRLSSVKDYLREIYGVDTLDSVQDLIKDANLFLEQYKPFNKKQLDNLLRRIKIVDEELSLLERQVVDNKNLIENIELKTKSGIRK